VFLLGPPQVDDLPPPSRTDPMLRPKALEILVYLATHGGKANRDDILYDVLGDAPAKRVPGRLNTFVYSLRRTLKTAAAGWDGAYVGAPDQDYALNGELIDLDLWSMQDTIARAATAPNTAGRVAALRDAVACYTGPLAEGKGLGMPGIPHKPVGIDTERRRGAAKP
jgi:two-component SAPR family response regulator